MEKYKKKKKTASAEREIVSDSCEASEASHPADKNRSVCVTVRLSLTGTFLVRGISVSTAVCFRGADGVRTCVREYVRACMPAHFWFPPHDRVCVCVCSNVGIRHVSWQSVFS